MQKVLEYKGYTGRVEFDDEARLFHGEVIGLRDVVTFQGTSVDELEEAFQDSIDDYLEFCEERGQRPDKPFSGRFLARIPPTLHRKVYTRARAEDKSLNQWVSDVLEAAVQDEVPTKPAAPSVSDAIVIRSFIEKGFSSYIDNVGQSNLETFWGNLPLDSSYELSEELEKELDDTLTSLEIDIENVLGVPRNTSKRNCDRILLYLSYLAHSSGGTQDKDALSAFRTKIYRMVDEKVREQAGGRKED